MTFEEQLEQRLFDDDLGSLAREYVGSTESWQALIALLAKPSDPFWDDSTTTGKVETEADILARSHRRRRGRPPFVARRRRDDLDLGPDPHGHVP